MMSIYVPRCRENTDAGVHERIIEKRKNSLTYQDKSDKINLALNEARLNMGV